MNKKNDETNRFILILGIISSLTGIATNITNIINSEYSKILFTIGVAFFIIFFLTIKKKKATKSTLYNIAIFLTSLLSSLICLNFYGLFSKKPNQCLFKSNFTSIGISNFNDKEENFSLLAYEFLKEEKLDDSLYCIKKVNRNFFTKIADSSFSKTLDSLCLKKGLIISGRYNQKEQLFYCKIKIRNLYQRKKDSLINKLVTYRNPDTYNFSIDYQAQMLVNFVLAIISFSEMDLKKSEKLFSNCINNNKNKLNKKFLSDCNTFLGDIYSLKNQENKALNFYVKAFKLKKSDNILKPILYYYIKTKKINPAKKFFNEIQDKKKFNIEKIRKQLNQLETDYKKTRKSKNTNKVITVPSQGSFKIKNTNITIEYTSVTTYDFKNRKFFIYTTIDNKYGVFDSMGRVLKMPDFKTLHEAKEFIKKLLK